MLCQAQPGVLGRDRVLPSPRRLGGLVSSLGGEAEGGNVCERRGGGSLAAGGSWELCTHRPWSATAPGQSHGHVISQTRTRAQGKAPRILRHLTCRLWPVPVRPGLQHSLEPTASCPRLLWDPFLRINPPPPIIPLMKSALVSPLKTLWGRAPSSGPLSQATASRPFPTWAGHPPTLQAHSPSPPGPLSGGPGEVISVSTGLHNRAGWGLPFC